MDEIKRIEQLRKELHEHNYRYYVQNQPTISDQDFDFLMHELQDLEAKHPEMADPNSPTQRVGSDLNEEFKQVEHKYPMLSLANTYNEQDVADWYESVKKGLAGESFEVCCEMKYDGLSISLTYVEGRLTQAVSVWEMTKPSKPPKRMVTRSRFSTCSFGMKAAMSQNTRQAPSEREAI